MGWRRLGHCFSPDGSAAWSRSHAAQPTPLHLRGDVFRIYFSTRAHDNRSHVGFADVDLSALPHVICVAAAPLLEPGEDGSFDDSGISIGSLVRDVSGLRLYYMGWNLGVRSPWRNAIGAAQAADPDGPFTRCFQGPILDRSPQDPYTLTYPCVVRDGSGWRMWYGSNLSPALDDAHLRHTLKHATSDDGSAWQRDGRPIVALDEPGDYTIVRPSVLHVETGFLMAYAARGERYRIELCASDDGLRWSRLPDAGLLAAGHGWDGDMACYPALFMHRDRLWMAYNGNGYGASGFGFALWDGPMPTFSARANS